MNKIIRLSALTALCSLLAVGSSSAYQVLSSKELGKSDAKNQNIVVKCTTASGVISDQTCSLRRYAKCNSVGEKCNGWMSWKDLRDPARDYTDWRTAAADCCRAKGLR